MSATTTATTFLDLFTTLLNRMRNTLGSATPSTTNLNYAKAAINEALHDLHLQQNWPWSERDAILITHAKYSTGQISIASTSRTTLEGSGGAWNTAVPGMGFQTRGV